MRAVRERDAGAWADFVYAVRTTGVYCRAGCAARLPRPENMAFYPTAAAAEAAGFRPCRRCRPEQDKPAGRAVAAVRRACAMIRAAEVAPPLATLAAASGYSPTHFQRLFTRMTGLSPRRFAAAERARRMAGLLPGAGSVTEAIYAAGFNSAGRFYATAGRTLGMRPAQARQGGAGMDIMYTVTDSVLGPLLVAASPRGVCAISLGDDAAALTADLHRRFPRARLAEGDAAFHGLVASVVGLVEAPGAAHDLPLDIQGTAFQALVWNQLRAIPPGTTTTYGDIARAIGRPRAARAVGAACGANPVAVAIPCHRVVGRDGGETGYRWGAARKRALLAAEKTPAKTRVR